MQVIPVIDLLGGRVVRGIAGRRDQYRPIVSQLAADARPATVARALVERFGFETVYVADLDAIVHGRPDTGSWEEIAQSGLRLWIDAGVGTTAAAAEFGQHLARLDIDATLIVGLESLVAPMIVYDLCRMQGCDALVFSLDLKQGQSLTQLGWHQQPERAKEPLEIARMTVSMGIRRLIVLDLADVGVGAGTRTLDLCRAIRDEFADLKIITGGGVRGVNDLHALADAGCDAALVASALHDGRLTRDDVERAKVSGTRPGRRDA
jgi:phosphoribosylformimino-5-aminoimidazole carboxamide ribotide isomerase